MAKLTNLIVEFISLVNKPATGKQLTLKHGDHATTFAIRKADDERMVAYGIVYAPNQPDSHDDYADAETIRRAAYEFLRKRRTDQVDVQHSFDAANAFVAESWIVRSGDEYFPNDVGAWAVGIQVWDRDVWKQLTAGELTGISLAGIATRVSDEAQSRYTEKTLLQAIKSLFTKSGEDAMTEAEITTLVKSVLTESLPDALAAIKDQETEKIKKSAEAGKLAALEKELAALKKQLQPAGEESDRPASVEKDEEPSGPDAALDAKIAAAVAKAVAKGAEETGDKPLEESFA